MLALGTVLIVVCTAFYLYINIYIHIYFNYSWVLNECFCEWMYEDASCVINEMDPHSAALDYNQVWFVFYNFSVKRLFIKTGIYFLYCNENNVFFFFFLLLFRLIVYC